MWNVAQILANYQNVSKVSHPIEDINPIGLNVWLIHVPQSTAREYEQDPLINIFEYAPLRFDSYVFGLYEEIDGNKRILLIKTINNILFSC